MNILTWTYRTAKFVFSLAFFALWFTSCDSTKYVPEDSFLLDKVKVVSDDPAFNASALAPYVQERPNSQLFSLAKVPLNIYSLSGADSTKWINRLLRKIGEEPVLYDSLKAVKSCDDLLAAMQSMGYMHSSVTQENLIGGKKLSTTYVLHPRQQYNIRNVEYMIADKGVAHFLDSIDDKNAQLHSGTPFSVSLLNNERKRITQLLNNSGYYLFNKDFIDFKVDTTAMSNEVDVTLRLYPYKANNRAEEQPHSRYKVRYVNYENGTGGETNVRRSQLINNTFIKENEYYSRNDLQRTYNNFARLGAVRYTNIRFSEVADTTLLDCNIQISTNKPLSISFQPEGTNTAGDLGAAASLGFENRNTFHGSELFSLKLRAAFEAITGLEGYQDQDYQEYGVESKLVFPRMVAPFLSRDFRLRSSATSELAAGYESQNRPEFHRRVFSATWRYRWNSPLSKSSYRFDLLDMNYIYMPWISETFKNDFLDSDINRNAILRYNYEDLFIMKIGLGYSYRGKNIAIKTNIETSGNLLEGISQFVDMKKNSNGQNTLFKIAYAQYVKGDIDYTKQFSFDQENSLWLHAAVGIAYPYGNSTILPFEKRYFTGGANSVRGWSVRSLGPGRFKGNNGRIDFINQTGDVKLDLSMEFRTKLFWKFNGAAFIDAGNIWTLREYKEQPGGQFKIDEFYKEIAVAYGIGMRLNLGYFSLRFDLGVKAVNPAYETQREHFPILHPKLGRDLAFHFAVGLPF